MFVLASVVSPGVASAQIAKSGSGGQFEVLLINILNFANQILIPFIMGIGFLVFVWGMFRYFIFGGADEEQRAKGRSLLVSALIGFVVIIIFFGVVNMIASSIGLEGESLQYRPEIPFLN